MGKFLCWGTELIAASLLVLFFLDMVSGFPFGGIHSVVDVLGILGCAIVGYLSWDAAREQR